MSDEQGYLKQLLSNIQGSIDAAFEKYDALAKWRREHEVQCEKRYQELKTMLQQISEKIDQRNAARDKREQTNGILKFIGTKPAWFVIMLLVGVLLFVELSRIDPETIKAIMDAFK